MTEKKEPVYTTQKDERGYDEKVDISVHNIMIVCTHPGCTEIRYVKPQDKAQVIYCKPHSAENKKNYRKEFMRVKRSK